VLILVSVGVFHPLVKRTAQQVQLRNHVGIDANF
jgi:hypothetical protein